MIQTRRSVLTAVMALTVARGARAARAERTLKAIHKRVGGRLGVHILDSQSGRRIGYEDGARFAMASTFKLPLAAALLWQSDRGAFSIDRALPISKTDLLDNSPELEARLQRGDTTMTVRELCAAAVVLSDNTAANLLLAGIGGPPAFTQFMRNLGDEVTRLDRNEPTLNDNVPDDPRDTTTPRAMTDSMLRIFTQDILSLPSRAMLIDWLTAGRRGLDRVRAGLPKDWQAGDKSGTGANAAFNDLAIVYPPGRRPIFVSVYMSGSQKPPAELAAAQADIGRLIAGEEWK
jgi:beta-lactamase class A